MRFSEPSYVTPPATEQIPIRLTASPQGAALAAALGLAGVVALFILPGGPRMPLLFAIGILLGVTLYHGAFGFTAAYRNLVVHRDVTGVCAQLVMLGVATVLFAPVLAAGSVFGHAVAGAVAPAGVPVAIGAFLFGIGMQLGSGCGSGTLYTAGGGSPRMLVVLAAFCAGSFWASLHMGWWELLPSLGTIALGEAWGWATAATFQVIILAALWIFFDRLGERQPAVRARESIWLRAVCGPWPLLTAAVVLAGLNFAVLLIAGHPWSITWAFSLWGAKFATLLGWSPADGFWSGEFQRTALSRGVLEDVTSLMDIGIMIGALGAAAMAGRFAPIFRIAPRSLLAALLGGVAMGYGARIAYGCNIGAFFSGVASTSVHGWLWIAAALGGTWVGVRFRPWFGLKN